MDGGGTFGTEGRVGPNAIIQLGNALRDRFGADETVGFFDRHGFGALIEKPPTEMIDQSIPAMLMRALWDDFDHATASGIAGDAGRRTADYIVANRIPRIARALFRVTPRRRAARMLLRAIERHAWTFAGSGVCETSGTDPYLISIRDNPLALPQCDWHVAVFERLFRRLVSGGAVVRHVDCCRNGGAVCTFEIEL